MSSVVGAQDQAAQPASPSLPAGDALRGFLATRLDPFDALAAPPQFRSDIDLNPGMVLTAQPDGYKSAAVLIALVEREEGVNVLLTRRSDTLRRHAGQIAFPGGRGEPGEAPWQTALREAEEEIGLDRDKVSLIGMSTPFRLQTGYDVTPVVGFVQGAFQAEANPDEVAEVFEAPFAFLMDPANYERRFREGPGQPRWYYAITHGDHVIWGATAAMLRTLHDRLWDVADG